MELELKAIFEACAEERRLARERLLPLFVRMYNAGYDAGHKDTVNDKYVGVYDRDHLWQREVVGELLDNWTDE